MRTYKKDLTEWRNVVGYEGYYEVSNSGEVRSTTRTIDQVSNTGKAYKRVLKSKIIQPQPNTRGYLRVELNKQGKAKCYFVQRIVAHAFLGERRPNQQVNHINGVKNDNRASNLEWCTSKENTRHAYITGLRTKENHNRAILTLNDVIAIRISYKKHGIPRKYLAKLYGVHVSTITKLINKNNWSWV